MPQYAGTPQESGKASPNIAPQPADTRSAVRLDAAARAFEVSLASGSGHPALDALSVDAPRRALALPRRATLSHLADDARDTLARRASSAFTL
jgi:hypothetical protein